jgi:hypothetical protein
MQSCLNIRRGHFQHIFLTASTQFSLTANYTLTCYLETRNEYLLLRGRRLTLRLCIIYVLHLKNDVIKIML